MRRFPILVVLLISLAVPAGASASKQSRAIEKPVRTLITAVRYGKDSLALKALDGKTQGALLLADDWSKGTPEQQREFVQLFHELFAALAFPNIRRNFEHLETILYEKPKVDGAKARVSSTLVILHPLKKQEIKIEYEILNPGSGKWRVVDVTVLGTGRGSMLESIRTDQIEPIMAEGGWDHLLKLMRERSAEVKAKAGK